MPESFKFSDVFNSQTVRGRANVAKATWVSVGVIYLLVKMQRNKAKSLDPKLYCKGCQQVLPS
ncbi:hypothetical protein KR054_001885 [Drosophila jambulina]|nr:hypothetical protein KR054_001885 [Drosophila jambulina]